MNYYSFFSFVFIYFFSFNVFSANIEILSDLPGTGPQIKNHYKVTVHYRGFLEDGTEFDSSFKRNQPFVFQIGLRKVIQGWDLGLMNMKVGGKRKIKIPPELAYGSRGAGESIPPNATLTFDIEIIAIEPPRYTILSPEKLNEIKNKDFVLIDIRTENQWKETGIIKNSIKLNAFDIKGNFNPSFLKKIEKIISKKSKKNTNLVFIDMNGDIAPILSNGFIEQLDYKNIFCLEGGIQKWLTSGYFVKKN
tara:strand:- start:1513 stop:2259 length:747 start_codon:yes stop_codon:yes gene_type:complete